MQVRYTLFFYMMIECKFKKKGFLKFFVYMKAQSKNPHNYMRRVCTSLHSPTDFVRYQWRHLYQDNWWKAEWRKKTDFWVSQGYESKMNTSRFSWNLNSIHHVYLYLLMTKVPWAPLFSELDSHWVMHITALSPNLWNIFPFDICSQYSTQSYCLSMQAFFLEIIGVI